MKISKRYFAKAVSARFDDRDGYYAQFALSGEFPQLVSVDGKPVIYDDERDAEFAAHQVLLKSLQARSAQASARGSTAMTPEEIFIHLKNLKIDADYLCELLSIGKTRMQKWLSGEDRVPQWFRFVLEVLSDDPFWIEELEARMEAQK